ncbi:MAG TPA: serine/threonine-protein kinase [Kofleriaceae bacterium]|nr:serine/threonine-protein kinase [Kofleriaceae bacterium]
MHQGADVSRPVRTSRSAEQEAVVHRVRVPHGKGEINLIVQVVEVADSAGNGRGHADDEATSIHAPVKPQEFVSAHQACPKFVLAPGGRVGKYELKEKLGQGTFGLVFTARDLDLDRDVAIKILNPSHQTNGDIVHRFLQEARASARIAHPGIVTVLDCGKVMTTIGESAYIVLELLQGESLTNRMTRSGRLAPHTAIEIARQVASGLDAAHRADVLHRDLKPDNIYLVPDPATPSGERVKILDFGLAKLGKSAHTMMNTVFGTPRYMSPEQCRSATMIDHRSDIYSLGCILFELVTGRTPFDGDLRQLIERHQRVMPPRARSFAPDVPQQLDDLIDQMLAKDPNARPQTMGAVQSALQCLGAVSPGVAATMMPVGAELIGLPAPRMSSPSPQHMQMQPGLPGMPPMPGMQMPGMQQPMPQMQPGESGMMLVPPTNGAGIPLPHMQRQETASVRKKRRRAPIAAAAIAFFVAAALTAVAARGRTRSASAEPAPQTPSTESQPTPAPAPTPAAPVAPAAE